MIKRDDASRSRHRTFAWLAVAVCLFVTVTASVVPRARAQQADDAMQILKAMTDYVSSQKVISATYDTDIEVITDNLQKIQFASSGQMLLNRPDKVRVSRVGGYADVEMVFDGKTLSVLGKNLNKFVQVDATGSVDELVARLRDQLGMAIPGADLMLARAYDELTADVVDAKHIGRGVIDDVECDHLAFRNHDVDWQLWVEVGNRPIPRKYVITSKDVTAHLNTLFVSKSGRRTCRWPETHFHSQRRPVHKKSRSRLWQTSTRFPKAWCREERNDP